VSFEFEARFFRRLLDEWSARPGRVLVVGCGAGVEVGWIARATGATVVGMDLDVDRRRVAPGTRLVRADAEALPFRNGAFDALYCYHVLEHVRAPQRAVAEARRVLAPGSVAYFGTPNKARLLGYVGGRATGWQKVTWNARDWWQRLSGRWDNARGAHAGFTDRELAGLLGAAFSRVESVSLPYYLGKYPRLANLWRASFRLGLARFLAPSVYFRTAHEAADAAFGAAASATHGNGRQP
jgi:SAM-dependent methyltransferase